MSKIEVLEEKLKQQGLGHLFIKRIEYFPHFLKYFVFNQDEQPIFSLTQEAYDGLGED